MDKEGYRSYETQVQVQAGSTTTVIASLIPETQTATPTPTTTGTTGTLQVASNPPAAGVYLDDVLRGITPLTITGIPQAVHNVEVDKEGYQSYQTQIYIWGGIVTPLNVTLSPSVSP